MRKALLAGLVLVVIGMGLAFLQSKETERPPSTEPTRRAAGPTVTPTESAADTRVSPLITDMPHHDLACSENKSYGRTVAGKWLRTLFMRLRAPGGLPIEVKDIVDTGTALQIRAPAQEPVLYSTLLPRSSFEHEVPENVGYEVLDHRGFTVLHTAGDFAWESFVARSPRWQLALVAYPGSRSNEVSWPRDIVVWMKAAIDELRVATPDLTGRLLMCGRNSG